MAMTIEERRVHLQDVNKMAALASAIDTRAGQLGVTLDRSSWLYDDTAAEIAGDLVITKGGNSLPIAVRIEDLDDLIPAIIDMLDHLGDRLG